MRVEPTPCSHPKTLLSLVIADSGQFVDCVSGLVRPTALVRRPEDSEKTLRERFIAAVSGGGDGLLLLSRSGRGGVDGFLLLLRRDFGRVNGFLPFAADPNHAACQNQDDDKHGRERGRRTTARFRPAQREARSNRVGGRARIGSFFNSRRRSRAMAEAEA